MKLFYTERFRKSYVGAPLPIRLALDKQTKFLKGDLRHPSLRAKKYDEANDIWQARITRDWRFYFKIEGDTYYLLDMISHPK
jgi:mRNA interferase RelE/StbE